MASFSGGPKVGHKMKLYRNAATLATPAWEEIADIGDVTVDGLELTTAELKRRGNNWTKELLALFGAFSVGFRYVHGLGAAMFEDLKNDFFGMVPRTYAVCNGAIGLEGTQGMTFAGAMKAFPWDQPLEDVSGHDASLCHTYLEESAVEIDPEWFTSEGSA
ncbi:MAG: hypothetical protein AB7U73_15340 [Pirellulales bacterium]